jgi:multiple sugar transport system ATP-binding protein
MASVKLENVYKEYPNGFLAVDNFNLDICDNEFIVLVGPSGCGKSTTLRMIAGLEEISGGSIYIDAKKVNDVEPKDRNCAMVFQNYALYPHMSVFDNMALSLKIRKLKKPEIKRRVEDAAKILGLTEYLNKKPRTLSGGQRQRVALGRAIVRNPKVFLLDEPLSNLDAKLRTKMRTEIIKLYMDLGTTFIYVTHDQVEAMTMGTKIVVMKDGVIQQADSPQNIFDHPANIFVGGFIGSPEMNFIGADVCEDNGKMSLKMGQNRLMIPESVTYSKALRQYIDQKVIVGIRPESIEVSEDTGSNGSAFDSEVDVSELLGAESLVYFKLADHDFTAKIPRAVSFKPRQRIHIQFDVESIHIFDMETKDNIVRNNMLYS